MKKQLVCLTTGRSDAGMILPVYDAACKLAQHQGVTVQLCSVDALALPGPADVCHAVVEQLARVFAIAKERTLLLVAGDRYEHVVAASFAIQNGAHVAHIGGGESNDTYFPDTHYRNALTCMARVHYTANDYARRHVAGLLGKAAASAPPVLVTGLPSLDKLDFKRTENLRTEHILFCYNPLPAEFELNMRWLELCGKLLRALSDMWNLPVYMSMPNADHGAGAVANMLKNLKERYKFDFINFSSTEFLYRLNRARLLVGNTSAGRIEASAFGTPVLEVTNRQAGRLCPYNVERIADPYAAQGLLLSTVDKLLARVANAPRESIFSPWRNPDGNAAGLIADDLLQRAL